MPRKINGAYFALRWKILERDNYTCQYCGQYAPNVMLEIDHILPVEDGGMDNPENLKTACSACNRGKSGLRISQARSKNLKPKSFALALVEAGQRSRVLDALKDNPLTLHQLAQILNRSKNSLGVTTCRLVKRHLLKRIKTGASIYYHLEE